MGRAVNKSLKRTQNLRAGKSEKYASKHIERNLEEQCRGLALMSTPRCPLDYLKDLEV